MLKERHAVSNSDSTDNTVPRVDLALCLLSLITLPSQLKTDTIHHHAHADTLGKPQHQPIHL